MMCVELRHPKPVIIYVSSLVFLTLIGFSIGRLVVERYLLSEPNYAMCVLHLAECSRFFIYALNLLLYAYVRGFCQLLRLS